MTPPSLSAPDPMSGASCTSGATALAETVRAIIVPDRVHVVGITRWMEAEAASEYVGQYDDALAALDSLLALAVRAQDSAPGGALAPAAVTFPADSSGVSASGGAGAEDIAAVRRVLDGSVYHQLNGHRDALAALARLAVRLAATEAERDDATAAVYAALHISTEEPSDAAIRFFQRLHEIPEVGGLGAALARLAERLAEAEQQKISLHDFGSFWKDKAYKAEARLAATEAERNSWKATAETLQETETMADLFADEQDRRLASEAHSAKLEAALRDARPYVADPAFDPPDSWLAELTARIDAALDPSPAAEGEA